MWPCAFEIASMLAQIGLGPIDIGKAMQGWIDVFCWLIVIAPLCCVGFAWLGTLIAQKRFGLSELMMYVGYWAGVFAIAALVVNH